MDNAHLTKVLTTIQLLCEHLRFILIVNIHKAVALWYEIQVQSAIPLLDDQLLRLNYESLQFVDILLHNLWITIENGVLFDCNSKDLNSYRVF